MFSDWLLTWTTYGTWLPGDERGFVTDLPNHRGRELRKNKVGTEYPAKMRGLARYARSIMHGAPLQLTLSQAELLLPQFQENLCLPRLLAACSGDHDQSHSSCLYCPSGSRRPEIAGGFQKLWQPNIEQGSPAGQRHLVDGRRLASKNAIDYCQASCHPLYLPTRISASYLGG